MQDYIEIEKLWYDCHMMQLGIVCSSAVITASAEIYVDDYLIDNLISKITEFLNGKVMETTWANGWKGDGTAACVSFRFLHRDKLGHILIEVYMELEDGGNYSSHNCCFYISTEPGSLERFCKKLPVLKQKSLGIKIILNESD